MNRPYKVYRIEDGIVLDHIPNKMALKVLKVLDLDKEHDSLITMGINLNSNKNGKKDVIKIENKYLSENDLNKIAIIAPDVSINIIKNGKIVNKHIVKLPDVLKGVVKCPNPACITRIEQVESVFKKTEDPKKIKCHYCERDFDINYVNIL